MLPDADGKPVLSFESLRVNLELSSLWRRGASFKEIAIARPYARALVRENSEFNLTDLIKPFEDKPGETAEPSEPARLFIGLFRMDAGQVHFEDRTLATPYTADLTPLSFELRDFSTTESTDNAYDLHAQADSGATLDWSGSMTLTPFTSQGRFKFANINARRHWAYLRDAAASTSRRPARIRRQLRRPDRQDDGIQGDAQPARDGRARHQANRPGNRNRAIREALACGRDFDLAKRTAGIEKVEIAGGSVQAWREADGSINLLELTETPDKAAASSEVPAATAPRPQNRKHRSRSRRQTSICKASSSRSRTGR